MRAVLDTNIVISGLLYSGKPHELLQYAHSGKLKLFSSRSLLTELSEVLARPKFARRLRLLKTTPETVLLAYLAVVEIVSDVKPERVVTSDEDDDEVIACALTAEAEYVITGDDHLLKIGRHQSINIIVAADAIDLLKR
jgi:putative PIN family toxin of toxin-antitoxin system